MIDILPSLKQGDSWLRRNCLETKRFDGLTIARQFVDAPTKYHFSSMNVTVMDLPTTWACPRPIVQTEIVILITAVTEFAARKPLVNPMHGAAILGCNLLQDFDKLAMGKVVHLATP